MRDSFKPLGDDISIFFGPLLRAYAQDGKRQGRGRPGPPGISCRCSDRVLTCGNANRKLFNSFRYLSGRACKKRHPLGRCCSGLVSRRKSCEWNWRGVVSAGPRHADGGCVIAGLGCLLCFVMARGWRARGGDADAGHAGDGQIPARVLPGHGGRSPELRAGLQQRRRAPRAGPLSCRAIRRSGMTFTGDRDKCASRPSSNPTAI